MLCLNNVILYSKSFIYIFIILISFFGCRKPLGSKRINIDDKVHIIPWYNMPWCGSYSSGNTFAPPNRILFSDLATFEYYYGCIDSLYPSRVMDKSFVNFDTHDLLKFEVSGYGYIVRTKYLSVFVDEKKQILYVKYKYHVKTAGSDMMNIRDFYFIEIPKGYGDYELIFDVK